MQMLTVTINVCVDDDTLKPMWEQMLTVDINVGVEMLTVYPSLGADADILYQCGADADSLYK